MTEDRDPTIQALFAEAEQTLNHDDFVKEVMARTQSLKYRLFAGGLSIFVVTIVAALLLSVPLIDFAFVITNALSTELIIFTDSNIAWFLAPINNVASLLVVIGKILKTGINRARQATFA